MCVRFVFLLKFVNFVRYLMQSQRNSHCNHLKMTDIPEKFWRPPDKAAEGSVSIAGGVVWIIREIAGRKENPASHTFWRYDQTSTLGRTTVDSLDNIDQLKARKSCMLSRQGTVYLLLVVHWPVTGYVVDERRDVNTGQRSLTSCCCFRYQDQS
jgi:hypothetical protein